MKRPFLQSCSFFPLLLVLAFGWSCGKKEESKPAATAPTGVTLSAATNITASSAILSGRVDADGGAALTAKGFVFSKTNLLPALGTDGDRVAMGTGIGAFSVTISDLEASTQYFVRAYATNSQGTTYSPPINFTTAAAAGANFPVLTSNSSVTGITQTGAEFGGNISSDGGSPVTARGVCWNTEGSPTVSLSTKTTNGSGSGSFTSSITGLTAGTTYIVRAYATNANGTAYGNEVAFTTTTAPITVNITFRVNMRNEAVSAQGVHIAGSFQNPAWQPANGAMTNAGGGIWTYTAAIPQNTTIQYKFVNGNAWGNNENVPAPCGTSPDGNRTLNVGTADQTVTYCYNSCSGTCPTPSVTDIDGNVYPTVQIGTQTWMKENLRVTKFRNGDPIPNPTGNQAWPTTNLAYAAYNNDPANSSIYGNLYKWGVTVDNRKVCPVGWHVPTDSDWTTLTNYLGGESVAGAKLMAVSTLWVSSGSVHTDESGFSAMPGGYRITMGFYRLGLYGHYWSSSYSPTSGMAWSRLFRSGQPFVEKYEDDWSVGQSIRCVKD